MGYSHSGKCHNRAVYRYGVNRTSYLPRCLSLFGMFIYRPINAQPVALRNILASIFLGNVV